MDEIEKQIIDGLILSDGYLTPAPRTRKSIMRFTLKYREFAESIQVSLPSLSWGQIIERDTYDKRTGNAYHQIHLASHVDEYLTHQRHRWYPDGKKIIPKDLNLTSTTMLWWYLGDGCLLKKKIRPKFRRLALATNSFSPQEVDFLIEKLTTLVGDDVYPEGKGIIISRNSITRFASLVGSSPVECYAYKFDFGQYLDVDYKQKSYEDRPLKYINEFRKQNRVRELNYIDKTLILKRS